MKLTGPVASIIVALIVMISLLFGAGSLTPPQPTYATVQFDGGYERLGVIKREKIYTEVAVTYNGETIFSGNFEEVIPLIEKSLRSQDQERSRVTWNEGVVIAASAGIEWTGSDGNFKLSTDALNKTSTAAALLSPALMIDELNALKAKAKRERVANAAEALSFGPAPSESFLLSRIAAALQK